MDQYFRLLIVAQILPEFLAITSNPHDFSIEFYPGKYHTGRSIEFTEIGCTVDGCTDLGTQKFTSSYSVKTGGCVQLFARRGCGGASVELKSSSTDLSEYNFSNRVKSFRPCTSSQDSTIRLYAAVKRIDFLQEFDDIIQKSLTRPVQLAAELTFINNGSQVQEKRVSESKTYKTEFTVERIESLSHLFRVTLDLGIKVSGEVGIPFLAAGSIEAEIKNGYAYERSSSGSERIQNTTSNEETFSIDTTVRVSPCEASVARFLLYVTDKMLMDFKLTNEITGMRCGKQILAEELRRHLPQGMEFLRNHNETTMVTTTLGRLYASIGVKTLLKIDSHSIPNCISA